MSGRHRHPLPTRVGGRRLIGASASGLAAVFALAPLAHADAPVDPAASSAPADPAGATTTPASDVPSSDAPTGDAPTGDAPTGDAPSSDAPTSDSPTSDVPTGDVPTSDSPTSGAPTSDAPPNGNPSAAVAKKQVRAKAALVAPEADYGTRKVYAGVQLADGSYAPNGTAGSVITFHETGPNAPTTDFTCTTVADPAPNEQDSSCPPIGPFGVYRVNDGDTLTVTQTSAPDGTVADPAPQVFDVCMADPNNPAPGFLPDCSSTATFTDTGVPPDAADDGPYTVLTGTGQNLDVSANDDTHGAPLTSVDVTQPAHGTVAVQQTAAPAARRASAATAVTGPFTLRYTPNAGYVGADPFSYTITTANGTSNAAAVSVSVVAPPPTATNDAASTKAGDPVTIDVLANDDANGGGALAIGGASAAAHGTARVEGNDFVYKPADGFSGTDTFTYTVGTAYGTDSATVTVTVTPPVTPPPPSNAPADDNSGLADTGVPTESLLDGSVALLVAGAAAMAAGRRRRRYRGAHA